MSYTDYAHTFNKAEFQTVCVQCSCHIAICNCLKDQITEEYMQMECERQNYYNSMDDIYEDEKLNEKIYEKNFKEQMDCD
jgi:hypothetical protein